MSRGRPNAGLASVLQSPPPRPLSDRVKEIARDPARKIEAIKLCREETGASLADAKQDVEDYIRNLDR